MFTVTPYWLLVSEPGNLDPGSPVSCPEMSDMVGRQGSLNLDFTIQLVGSNLEFAPLVWVELFWTLM